MARGTSLFVKLQPHLLVGISLSRAINSGGPLHSVCFWKGRDVRRWRRSAGMFSECHAQPHATEGRAGFRNRMCMQIMDMLKRCRSSATTVERARDATSRHFFHKPSHGSPHACIVPAVCNTIDARAGSLRRWPRALYFTNAFVEQKQARLLYFAVQYWRPRVDGVSMWLL